MNTIIKSNRTKFIMLLAFLLSGYGYSQCWTAIETGGNHSITIKNDGTLWSWGNDGTMVNKNEPSQLNNSNWLKISAGAKHTMAIRSDGTLWAWGNNSQGQLGDGTNIDRNQPIQITTSNNWLKVSSNYYHTLAIKTDGTLWAWGRNNFGTLGDGTYVNKNTPVQIGTSNMWSDISTGNEHSIAIKKDGTLWAWGQNSSGQLGTGTTVSSKLPIKIGVESNWAKISAGSSHCLAIKLDGTLWGWGYNGFGQLGDGTNINKISPIQISTISPWSEISAGYDSSFSINSNGALWAWGNNFAGKLGDGTNTDKNILTQIGTNSNWLHVNSAINSTIALTVDGDLWTWGSNLNGQLGVGSLPLPYTFLPYSIACPKPVISISGKSTVCSGDANVVYTVPTVNNATSYVWSLPSGVVGSSTTNTITVNFGLNSISGKVTVKALNNSVEITSSSLDVIVNSKPISGLISGSTNVIEGQQGVAYSINPVSNATNYIWTLPTGAIGSSNTNSIKVDFGINAQSGNISVKAVNSCGESNLVTIFVKVAQPPKGIGTISGKSIVCSGENNVVYTVPVVNNATSYIWSLPSGVIGTSTTNTININFGLNSISGNISVKAINAVGESETSIFYVKVNNKPLNSAEIVGEKLVTQGQKDVIYTITEIPSVTSYIWSLPVGATGVSTTNSIKVNFDQTFTSGNISVYAKNDCGTSSPSTLKIEVTQPVFSKISIIGDAVKDWFTDIDLTTEDGVVYNLLGQKLSVGGIKFRQDYTWTKRWGGISFPTGIGVENDSNIMVNTEGIYDIQFNLNTREYIFNLKTLGLNDYNITSSILIHPNPTTHQLTLTHTEPIKKASVYNYLGQLVLSQYGTENTIQLNVENLPNGNYLVKIESSTEAQTVKFVKE